MAAATTILAGAALATSTGLGINQAIQGDKQAKEAREAIENYDREEFRNVYAGITLPMERTRLETEGVKEGVSTSVDALSRAGSRGLIGGLPQVLDYSSESLSRIGASLEESMFQIQTLIAEDEKRIQSETARREEEDLAGLGALYQAGKQESALGLSAIPRGLGSASSILSAIPTASTPQTTVPQSTSQSGNGTINPMSSVEDLSRFNKVKGV